MTSISDVLEFHDVASLFPLMEGSDFDELKADIRQKGLLVPILLAEGKIADGRNRFRACSELGIEAQFVEWSGTGDLLAYIVSLNLYRRHLSASQRSTIGGRIKPQFEAEAKERQRGGQGGVLLPANLPEAKSGDARGKVAELVNVSPRMIDAASKVLDRGVPELIQAVDDGKVKVSAAALVADLPKPEQSALVEKGQDAVKEKAREIREQRQTYKGLPLLGPGEVAFPIVEGEAKGTAGWEATVSEISNMFIFVRENGGFAGSVHGWTNAKKKWLHANLTRYLGRITSEVPAWIKHLEESK